MRGGWWSEPPPTSRRWTSREPAPWSHPAAPECWADLRLRTLEQGEGLCLPGWPQPGIPVTRVKTQPWNQAGLEAVWPGLGVASGPCSLPPAPAPGVLCTVGKETPPWPWHLGWRHLEGRGPGQQPSSPGALGGASLSTLPALPCFARLDMPASPRAAGRAAQACGRPGSYLGSSAGCGSEPPGAGTWRTPGPRRPGQLPPGSRTPVGGGQSGGPRGRGSPARCWGQSWGVVWAGPRIRVTLTCCHWHPPGPGQALDGHRQTPPCLQPPWGTLCPSPELQGEGEETQLLVHGAACFQGGVPAGGPQP